MMVDCKVGTIFEDNDTAELFEVVGIRRVGFRIEDAILTFKNHDATNTEQVLVEHTWGVVQRMVAVERTKKGNRTKWRKFQ